MPRQPQPAPIDGALVINKPKGKTSHDVVDAVRHLAGFRQIGHLGTLDPLATGVLVLLLGRATRLVQFYSGRRKRYSAGFRFGYATDTYDSEGEAQGPDAAPLLDAAVLDRLAPERLRRHRISVQHLYPFAGSRDGAEARMRRASGVNHAHRRRRILTGAGHPARRTC